MKKIILAAVIIVLTLFIGFVYLLYKVGEQMNMYRTCGRGGHT